MRGWPAASVLGMSAGRRCEDGPDGDGSTEPQRSGSGEATLAFRRSARGVGPRRSHVERKSVGGSVAGRRSPGHLSGGPGDADRHDRRNGSPFGHRPRRNRAHRGPDSKPAPARVLPLGALRERPDGERPQSADAGPSLLIFHRARLADRPHDERHSALQAGVGTVHHAQHLAATDCPRPEIHGGTDVGMGVHLRPGVSGRCGHTGRGVPPSARPSPVTRAPPAMRGSSSSPEPA